MAAAAGARMVTRPAFRDRPEFGTREEPEPLAALAAARRLQSAAAAEIAASARAAREDGRTWEEIGAAAGFRPSAERTAAEAGFGMIAGPGQPGRAPAFYWHCPACDRTVSDYGPETGNPAEAEAGHAGDCPRLAAQAAARDEWQPDDG